MITYIYIQTSVFDNEYIISLFKVVEFAEHINLLATKRWKYYKN